ncbi:hypothetical protein WOSG25_022000 [Weissella oryzae SG25]|uniref:Uncharacterized protein n=1 Tax=Weissella oryzae (strain DSM 25784 / JCM 18191 / LMG 30913 / SG25) TaxID=1329250 RepID=A0A069CT44_WEIOS|nr:hypothetical protein [Weissella oryzae]GAK30403.1 hypothetical protein WOSG25_022000 [Weissella oryzae SG25]
MSDIQEAISTLNKLLESAKSSKALTAFLGGFDETSTELVSQIKTAQKNEIVLLTALLSEAELKAQQEQLYYVLSPINDLGVLNEITVAGSQVKWHTFASSLEGNHQDTQFKTRFNQSELDSLKNKFPRMNFETSTVRVEDYDNEHA